MSDNYCKVREESPNGDSNSEHCHHDIESDRSVCCWCGDVFVNSSSGTVHGEYAPTSLREALVSLIATAQHAGCEQCKGFDAQLDIQEAVQEAQEVLGVVERAAPDEEGRRVHNLLAAAPMTAAIFNPILAKLDYADRGNLYLCLREAFSMGQDDAYRGNRSPLDFICPTCGAVVGEKCRRANGRIRTREHTPRRQLLNPNNPLHRKCPKCSAAVGVFCKDNGVNRPPHSERKQRDR